MAIYFSGDLYLTESMTPDYIANRPAVGWHSHLRLSDYYATSSAPGYYVSSMWSPDTYTRWQSSTATSTTEQNIILLQVQLGDLCDYIGVVGHNFGTDGIGFGLRAIPSGGTIIDAVEVFAPFIPSDDAPIMYTFDQRNDLTYVVDLFVPATKSAKICHLKLGQLLRLARPVWVGETPAGFDRRVDIIDSTSYNGKYLGSIKISEGEAYSIDQKNNRVDFIRSENFQNFIAHAHRLEEKSRGPVGTFFYAWRPDTHPSEIQYCSRAKSYSPPQNTTGTKTGGLMSWNMSGEAFR